MSRFAQASLVLGCLLVGCGIDQGGVAVTGGPGGVASDRAVLVSGPITGFGSVLVNGLHLDASAAQILVDGQFATEADLRVGQVVRAVATFTSGAHRAVSIEYEDSLVGPIAMLDAAADTLSVLAQPVIIDSDTRFEPPLVGEADLAPGLAIAVSGLPLPNGQLHATFVRRAEAAEALQVAGTITTVETPSLSFDIGDLHVDYSQVSLMQLPMGMPAVGQLVEVRGTALAGDTLIATEIGARSSLPGLITAATASLTDFEASLAGAPVASTALAVNFIGYLSARNLPSSISVADIEVLIGGDTILGGGVLSELDVGKKVRVEGTVLNVGQVQADRIELL